MKKVIIPFIVLLIAFVSCKKSTPELKQTPKQDPVVAQAPAAAQPLTARFSYKTVDPINIFEHQDIGFMNLSTGATSCVWEFGNSTKTQDKDPVISYPWHGYYTVKLTVFDGKGNEQSTTQNISILCLYPGGVHPANADQ